MNKKNKKSKAKLNRIARDKQWQAKSQEIRARDNNECQLCKSKSNLNVHHIINRSHKSLWLDDNNLITLCCKCHKFSCWNSAHRNSFIFSAWFADKYEDRAYYLISKFEQLWIKQAAKI